MRDMESRRAKIVCTIGPATRTEEMLTRLIEAGMDVCRLNMSHGTHEEHGEVITRIRKVSAQTGKQVAILMDLSGPKIRIGELPAPRALHVGDEVWFTTNLDAPREGDIPVKYPQFTNEVGVGERFSLADGLIHMECLELSGERLKAKVHHGGTLSSSKGVNLPTGGEGLPSLTDKDAVDLRFGLKAGVDWVSLSFVRSPSDAGPPRRIMEEEGRRVPLMAKIEKPQALLNLDAIVKAFDGIMVARGDLGVEVPLERLPIIQKDVIARANRLGKPVVTATQMLLTMVGNPTPSRAETTDVANAMMDGTDAVMLSEETAMGSYPVEAVKMMNRIGEQVARSGISQPVMVPAPPGEMTPTEAIAKATRSVALEIGAKAIVIPTTSGATARHIAATRPNQPILALSTLHDTVHQLGVSWGVTAMEISPQDSTDAVFERCRQAALETGLAERGDLVVVTAGHPLHVAGNTNILKILRI
ncbi:MAG: pyruvate kinase [Deltaproteobacteria bacterium]|nr:MAG: pyruvate kinase [Deltaproteobacteria bacterium]